MKIGIANDLPLVLEALRQTLTRDGLHEVVWMARDGEEAVRRCAVQTPDLILMDLLMPTMDGAEAIRRIMAHTPCPILVVTSSIDNNAPMVFEAMGAGALDAIDTPIVDGSSVDSGVDLLLDKITMIGRLTSKSLTLPKPSAVTPGTGSSLHQGLVVIGASSGGPQALADILGRLGEDFAAPIVIIQHVDRKFVSALAKWLSTMTKLPINLARHGTPPQAGNVYLACTNDHLVINFEGCFSYTKYPGDLVYRPSVDVFFNSIVEYWRGPVIGVLLTGMGNDGAEGLLNLRQHGWHTITQDKQSSAVFGMPKAAASLQAATEILPLADIGPRLERLLRVDEVAIR